MEQNSHSAAEDSGGIQTDGSLAVICMCVRLFRTVVLSIMAHLIQRTLRENQGVIKSIYYVYTAAHLVQTFGQTHIRCALRTKTTVFEIVPDSSYSTVPQRLVRGGQQ